MQTTRASGRALVVFVMALHASNVMCSRSSSRTVRSQDLPRAALRVAAAILYRSPVARRISLRPLTRETLSSASARSGVSSMSEHARSQLSSAVSRSWAVPSASCMPNTYMPHSTRIATSVVLPFWRATSSTIVRNRNRERSPRSRAWM
nr:MAG TPA: hypothetical protein [Caudoviricetes sp.]